MLTRGERDDLVHRDAANADRIFMYLGGEDVNTSPNFESDRYVINFGNMRFEDASRWKDLMSIALEKVKPERDRQGDARAKELWWQFTRPREELYETIVSLNRCLVTARVTKHLAFSFQPTNRVLNEKLYVFPFEDHGRFALLQSRPHEQWARLLSSDFGSSTIGPVLAYAASDCFETFPFPKPDPGAALPELEGVGQRLYEARTKYMADNHVGLTVTYNRLKDPENNEPEVRDLRRLHEDMDKAVLAAYGWSDITVPPYGTPVTDDEKKAVERFEDEVIDRLFALNAKRAEEERLGGAVVGAKQKGKAKGSPKAKRGAKKDGGEQLGLLGEEKE
jgi:hypothetical protein